MSTMTIISSSVLWTACFYLISLRPAVVLPWQWQWQWQWQRGRGEGASKWWIRVVTLLKFYERFDTMMGRVEEYVNACCFNRVVLLLSAFSQTSSRWPQCDIYIILIQLAHVYFNNLPYNFTVLFGTFLFAIIVPLWDFSFPFRSLFGASCLLATTFECSTWPSFLKSSGFNVDSWASLFL